MKNKKIPIITVSFIIIIIAAVTIISLMKNNNIIDSKITEISYSYGDGYGTIIDTAYKTITITQEGKVVLSNSYNSYTETFDIDQSKYKELSDFIVNRLSVFSKVKEDNDVLDGNSSSIMIKLKDGQTKKIGGYMVKDKKYNDIKDKIYEIIDSKKLEQYEKNIENN